METIVWVVVAVIVIVVLLVALKDKLKNWIFGGTGPRPGAKLSVGQSPKKEPAPPSGTKFVAKLETNDGNPIPAQNVTFTILAGSDGKITSTIDGNNVVPTKPDGMATVTVKGTDDGADQIKVEAGIGSATLDYETLKKDPA